jgi:hypothetical protein
MLKIIKEHGVKGAQYCIKKEYDYFELADLEREIAGKYILVTVKIDDDEIKVKFYYHQLIYGDQPDDFKHWSDRLENPITPFQDAQRDFANKGWYLLDESDPDVGKYNKFFLYHGKPENYGEKKLWHGLNLLPEDTTDEDTTDEEQ